MTLDWPAAILCGLFAGSLLHVYAISSPKRDRWLNLPPYVRRGLLASSAMLVWRSVNMLQLPSGDDVLGHINTEGMLALICLTYTAAAFAVYASGKTFANHGWSRLEWLAGLFHGNPNLTAVPMPIRDAVRVVRTTGAKNGTGHLALPPNAPPSAVTGAAPDPDATRH